MKFSTKIAKESAISFTGMGFGQIFRYLFTTLLARWAGVELLGVYSIANAVTRIMEVMGKIGLDQGILRKVSRENELQNKQAGIQSALKMGLFSGLVFMLLQLVFAGWAAETLFNQSALLTRVIMIHALSLPIGILIHIAAFSTQGFKLLKHKIFVTEIQNPLILLLAMVVFYFLHSAESAIMWPVVISSALGLFTISTFLKKVTGVSLFTLHMGNIDRELLIYSLPILFISILGAVLHWTDILMLGYFTDPATVGLYQPAARTAGIIRIIFLSFAGIYGPILAEMYAGKNLSEMNHLFKLVTRWITTFSLPLAILLLVYPQKIMLIFGSDFVGGYPILMMLAAAAFIQAVFGLGGTTLNMTGFPRLNLVNTFSACGLNIFLNLILIPKMGGKGAAWATLITLGFIAIIRGIQNWRLFQLNPLSLSMGKTIPAGIAAVAAGLLIKSSVMSLHTIMTLVIAGIIILSVFFFILWVLGFNKDDKELIAGINIIINNLKPKAGGN